MKLAVGNLKPVPDILFIDSLKLDDINIEQNSIVKGDAKSVSIAAASIIAKVTRDRILREMDKNTQCMDLPGIKVTVPANI